MLRQPHKTLPTGHVHERQSQSGGVSSPTAAVYWWVRDILPIRSSICTSHKNPCVAAGNPPFRKPLEYNWRNSPCENPSKWSYTLQLPLIPYLVSTRVQGNISMICTEHALPEQSPCLLWYLYYRLSLCQLIKSLSNEIVFSIKAISWIILQ